MTDKNIIFKKNEEVMLDTLMLNCSFHTNFDNCNCNNGYGCNHPDNYEDRDCSNKCKGCFGYSCPIAYQKNQDKDEEEGNWGSETVMVLKKDIIKLSPE